MWRRWCAVAALGALQACGSTGQDQATHEEIGEAYNDNRQDMIDAVDRLSLHSVTSEANLPTSGSATFEGQAAIVVGNPAGPDLSLVGDATVTADFGDGAISGRATDFLGTDETGISADEYDGTLNLSGGRIGAGGSSDVSGELSGTLASENHVVVIDAPVQGEFYGNPDIVGVALYGEGGIATVDGLFAPGSVGIVAER